MTATDTAEKKPCMVHCRSCGHEWVAFWWPLKMDAAGRKLLASVGRAPCPKCASPAVYMGAKPEAATP